MWEGGGAGGVNGWGSSCRLLINMRTCSLRPFSNELVWRLTTSAPATAGTATGLAFSQPDLLLLCTASAHTVSCAVPWETKHGPSEMMCTKHPSQFANIHVQNQIGLSGQTDDDRLTFYDWRYTFFKHAVVDPSHFLILARPLEHCTLEGTRRSGWQSCKNAIDHR